jgi:hypothetical protein
MRYKRQFVMMIVGAVAGVVLFGAVASAQVTIPENPVPISSGASSVTVTISYSNVPAGEALYFEQCSKNPSDPTFDFSKDCSALTQWQVNPASNTGSGTLDFSLFRGDEPSGDQSWGCYAAGDTPSAGHTKFTTCYIRVVPDTPSNNAQAQGLAFTFTLQGAPVPESPLTIALPFVAASVIGAAFVMNRRRNRRAPLPA